MKRGRKAKERIEKAPALSLTLCGWAFFTSHGILGRSFACIITGCRDFVAFSVNNPPRSDNNDYRLFLRL